MFDWAEYYGLAKNWFRHPEEAYQRSAVSRAYYAGFCIARNRLIQEGENIPESGEAHLVVWNTFGTSPDPKRLFISENGDRLRRLRGRADYVDQIHNLPRFVSTAEKHADDLLKYLRSL